MEDALASGLNEAILTILDPALMLFIAGAAAVSYGWLFWRYRYIEDLVSALSYGLVAVAYIWIITYDPGGTPGRAVFRLTIFQLLTNGAIRFWFALAREKEANKVR